MEPESEDPGGFQREGAEQILAGVEPVTGGWLVAPGRVEGCDVVPQAAELVPSLSEVFACRPGYAIVALHAPVEATARPGETRPCDAEARRRLGRRGGSVLPAPSRALLEAGSYEEARRIEPSLSILRWRAMAKAAEAVTGVPAWRRETVFEVHPELAFTAMNGARPLSFARRSQLGRDARRLLIEEGLPGAAGVLARRPHGVREEKLLDALADLWTACRIKVHVSNGATRPPVLWPGG